MHTFCPRSNHGQFLPSSGGRNLRRICPVMTPPATPSVLGSWLRDLREASGLSPSQAGETIGVSEREIRRWEKKNAPGGINLLRLLNAYNVRFEPSPPEAIPGAVNTELHALRVSLDHRLARLEARVERQGRATTKALTEIAASLERIEHRLDAQDPPASRPTTAP